MADLLVLLCVLVILALLLAHDTWLMAWLTGEETVAQATTSDRFPQPEFAIKPERVSTAARLAEGRKDPPVTFEALEVQSILTWKGSSHSVIGLQLHPHLIRLDRNSFAAYLAHEGRSDLTPLEHNTERYTKCAKAVLQSGPLEVCASTPIGHPLEIIFRDGHFQVLLHGRAAQQCRLTHLEDHESGANMVRTHFIRSLLDQEVQWESLWATLTFFPDFSKAQQGSVSTTLRISPSAHRDAP
jgi:hypothetical protein